MRIQITPYQEKNYDLLSSWFWAKHRPAPEPEFLPPVGFLAWVESTPICAAFLFKTDAKIAIINHVISNPEPFDTKYRDMALETLLRHLIFTATAEGFKMVSAACNVRRLGDRYESLGFVKTDSDEVHYGRAL